MTIENRKMDTVKFRTNSGQGSLPHSGGESTGVSNRTVRSTFWVTAAFYGLIALEFFYMFSPFAVYVYSVYGPGLQMLKISGSTSWMIGFFMPHIVYDTNSLLISWHEHFGVVLFAGFGMVLLWPRYLVLAGFVTICFAYYMLARTEERLCLKKFPGYAGYMEQTAMFLPLKPLRLAGILSDRKFRLTSRQGSQQASHRTSRAGFRFAAGFGLYVVVLTAALMLARWVHHYSVNSVYTHAIAREVHVSIGRMPSGELEGLASLARNDRALGMLLAKHDQQDHRS